MLSINIYTKQCQKKYNRTNYTVYTVHSLKFTVCKSQVKLFFFNQVTSSNQGISSRRTIFKYFML